MRHVFDSTALATRICQEAGEGCAWANEPLSAHTTFRIGGPAAVYARPASFQALGAIMRLCTREQVPVRFIGCGSNLLVSDTGVSCLVVEIGPALSAIQCEGSLIRAQGGATNRQVAEVARDAGLAGYEFASGIPGTVGAAAVMNAGAYGGELKDVAVELACIMPDGTLRRFAANEIAWGYRQSPFSEWGCAVAEVTLRLRPDDPQCIRARMEDLDAQRAAKQPLNLPSAGSTFKRPEGHYAGKLIQDAGLRGKRVGGAQVSEKHTGFIVNTGDATAEDVRSLIAAVQDAVFRSSGVHLEPEVRMWGFE